MMESWFYEAFGPSLPVLCRYSPKDGELCGHPAADPSSPSPLCDCHIKAAIADLYFAQYQRLDYPACGD